MLNHCPATHSVNSKKESSQADMQFVECFDDAEIAETIGEAGTIAEALDAFAPLIDVWSDRQADARNSAF